MMVLGLEEPLHRNKQIYTFDETVGEVVRSRVEDDGLNRYSFVWVGEYAQRDTTFNRLIQFLQEHLKTDACWYLVWENPAVDKNHTGPDPKEAERSKQGWAVHAGETLMVAQHMMELVQLTGFRPTEFKRLPGDAGLFLLFGDSPPAAPELVRRPLPLTLEDFVLRGELAPSSQFLSWVREKNLTLVYSVRDQISHHGLIVVSRSRINIEEMQQKGMIDTIHEGDDALLAWQYTDQ